MQSTIVYLIGFAGTGKHTIALEICRLTGARLVDNHLINNPVFSLIQADGKTRLPETVWEKTWAIRHVVLDVIREISPASFSFVFTNELIDGSSDDRKLFAEVEDLAEARRAQFVPVRLLCEEEELCRRVRSPGRAARFKETDSENAREKIRNSKVLTVGHPDALDLDVTALSASEAAQAILAHARSLSAKQN